MSVPFITFKVLVFCDVHYVVQKYPRVGGTVYYVFSAGDWQRQPILLKRWGNKHQLLHEYFLKVFGFVMICVSYFAEGKCFEVVRRCAEKNIWFYINSVLITTRKMRKEFNNLSRIIRGCADKSLARPTSQCRRTQSIVSLERGACSCAELQVFSCYRGWKEACQATRAISTTSRRELS